VADDGGSGEGPGGGRPGPPPELGSVWVAALKAAVLVGGGLVVGFHVVVGLVKLVW
jgi:hypothetical protein